MCKIIKILFLWLLIPFTGYAGKISTPLYMAIVSSDNSGVQISTTKNSLHGDSVLICSATKKPCSVYQSDDFSIAKPNDSVEDIATGKSIYTYSIFGSKSYKLQSETTVAFIFKTGSIGANNVEFDGKHSFVIKSGKIKYVISYCTSSEGVHVLSKSDDIHLYYSLGYEVEASCSGEVYK